MKSVVSLIKVSNVKNPAFRLLCQNDKSAPNPANLGVINEDNFGGTRL